MTRLRDPHTGGPSRFPLVTTAEAWRHLTRFKPVGTETVRVEDAAGRVLARDVRAGLDVPHFTRSYMDGYAVRARDTVAATPRAPVALRVVGTIEMGRPARRRLGRGEAFRIPTGGMLPPGATAVVMVEHTREPGDGTVLIADAARAGQHLMYKGDDTRRGRLVFRHGRRLGAHDVGALSGIGCARVRVFRRPRVAVLATGDEIVPPGVTPRPGQVRNVNHYALRALLHAYGASVVDIGVLPDRRRVIERGLARGLRDADLVVMSGGSSVGTKDLTPDVIRAMPRARILVHGMSIKPGKPTVIARAAGKPILGLPGNPTSAMVIFELFGVPLVRRLGGEAEVGAFAARGGVARLGAPIASRAGREDYVRVTLREDPNGDLVAHPVAGGSGEILSFVHADAMIRVPAPARALARGTRVRVHRLR